MAQKLLEIVDTEEETMNEQNRNERQETDGKLKFVYVGSFVG